MSDPVRREAPGGGGRLINALLLAFSLAALMISLRLPARTGAVPPTQTVLVTGKAGYPVRTLLCRPAGAAAPYPAVVCVHSFFQSEETALPMAAAMARAGYLAVSPRLESYHPREGRLKEFQDYLEDVRAVAQHLAASPEVRADEIFLMGHSMGADLACCLARELPVRGVVAVGFPVDIDAASPPSVLLAVGAWDQLHSLTEMRGVLRKGTGEAGDLPEVRYGSFERRTARTLAILPACDHPLETFDPELFRCAVRWMDACASRPALEPFVLSPDPFLLQGVAAIGWTGALLWLLAALTPRVRLDRIPLAGAFLGPRTAALLGMAGILALGAIHRAAPDPAYHRIMLGLLLAALLTGGWAAESGAARLYARLRQGVSLFFLYGAAAAAAVALSLAVNSASSVAWKPALLLGLPLCLASAVPLYLMKVSSVFFYTLEGTTGIHPILAALLLVEFLLPGLLFRLLRLLPAAAVKLVRSMRLTVKARGSSASVVALLATLAVAVYCWLQVFKGGYALDTGDVLRLAWMFGRLLVLPTLLLALVVRSPWFRRLEERICGP